MSDECAHCKRGRSGDHPLCTSMAETRAAEARASQQAQQIQALTAGLREFIDTLTLGRVDEELWFDARDRALKSARAALAVAAAAAEPPRGVEGE